MSKPFIFASLVIGDLVRTPKGALGVVTRCTAAAPHPVQDVLFALAFPERSEGEKNSWWSKDDGLQLVCRWATVKRRCLTRAGKRKAR